MVWTPAPSEIDAGDLDDKAINAMLKQTVELEQAANVARDQGRGNEASNLRNEADMLGERVETCIRVMDMRDACASV